MKIIKYIIIGLLIIIELLIIDYRLKEVEKIRCEMWNWEVCNLERGDNL